MTRSNSLPNERGVALPVALFALVVIGALVAGIFFTARIEVRSGENAMGGARALEAAQAGLQLGVPQVVNLAGTLDVGETTVISKTQLGTTGSYYEDSVTKLNNFVFLLRSYGTYEVNNNVTSTRVLAMLVKRYMPELEVNSGAIVVGDASIQGNVHIDGADHAPDGWDECTIGPAEPGLRTNGDASGNKLGDVEPSYSEYDTTVTNMSRVLDTMFFQLASQANFAFTGANVGIAIPSFISGACNFLDSLNWGDPSRSSSPATCQGYFPIIYINPGGPGNSVVVHVTDGQGVLLVNGDLKFNGTNNFAGLILVRGQYLSGGGDMTLTGSLISQNVDLDPSHFSGNLTINYSRCAVQTALNNLAVSAPASYRAFIQF